LLICLAKAVFVYMGQTQIGPWTFNLSKLTLVAEFAIMAVVLVLRPWGLLGKPPEPAGAAETASRPVARASRRARPAYGGVLAGLAALPWIAAAWPYLHVLLPRIDVDVLFAARL